jgi:hypothetical protein
MAGFLRKMLESVDEGPIISEAFVSYFQETLPGAKPGVAATKNRGRNGIRQITSC